MDRRGPARQADRIAFAKLQDCGHSCAALQVLILPDGWDQADLLLDDLRGFLRTLEPRAACYPGSDARVARALADEVHVEALGPDGGRFLVTVDDPGHACNLFRAEVFADVLGVVQLPAPDLESYLARAVEFANEALAGSLSATLLVDPDAEVHHRNTVANAVTGLRYGAVGLNEHGGFNGAVPHLLWGAYPGNTPKAIGSGVGFVNNTLLLPHPEQAVLRAAFRAPLKPFTFKPLTASHKALEPTCSAFIDWIASGDDPRKLPSTVLHALRG